MADDHNDKAEEIRIWADTIDFEAQEFYDPNSDKPYYELIEHKADYFLNDKLIFSGWQLIIEVWNNEDCDDHLGSYWPELIAGSSKNSHETFLIVNHPEYDDRRLTNGYSSLVSGNSEDIAKVIVDIREYDFANLLPYDKNNFTYFDSILDSQVIKSGFRLSDDQIIEYKFELIGAELFAFNQIIKYDEQIKSSIHFADYALLIHKLAEGYDEFELPDFVKLQKDENGEIIHSSRMESIHKLTNEEEKIFEKLAKKYNKEASLLMWYTAFKDFELPIYEKFKELVKTEITTITKYLDLFYKFNFPAYAIIVNKLRSYSVSIWDMYPDIVYKYERLKDMHNEITSSVTSDRLRKREFNSTESYSLTLKKEKEVEKELNYSNIYDEIQSENYIKFQKGLIKIEEELIQVEKQKQQSLAILQKQKEEAISQSNIHYHQGATHINERNYHKAIEELQLSLDILPKRAGAYIDLSACKYEIKDYDGAMSDIEKAFDLDLADDSLDKMDMWARAQNRARAYYMRALIKTNFGDKDGALDDYTKCLGIDEEHFDARNNRAIIYSDKREYDLAINDFNYIIDFDEANVIERFGDSTNFVEARANAYYGRAFLNKRFNNFTLAVKDYEKVIELDPNDIDSIEDCAWIYWELGEIEKTTIFLEKYVEINSENKQINDLLHSIRNRNRDVDILKDVDAYYFEKIEHGNDEDKIVRFTEFAIWSCVCRRGLSGDWDYDFFEKDELLQAKFFDIKKIELSEDDFYDLNDCPDPNTTISKISLELDELKNLMHKEVLKFQT